ncbi:MAG: hypothetical protein RLZZ624_1133 [Cyanobacteriota bacterium]
MSRSTPGQPPAAWQRLQPFPGSLPQPLAERLELRGACTWQQGQLRLRFQLQGALESLILPAVSPAPARCVGLWQHTCLEAFWGQRDQLRYWELNASPSGDWALYRFERYRHGQLPEPLPKPPHSLWTLTPATAGRAAQLALELVLEGPAAATGAAALAAGDLELSLTAVLEHADGRLSYWALAHPGPEPDFHDRQGFRLQR